jgi:hypothetical protein
MTNASPYTLKEGDKQSAKFSCLAHLARTELSTLPKPWVFELYLSVCNHMFGCAGQPSNSL